MSNRRRHLPFRVLRWALLGALLLASAPSAQQVMELRPNLQAFPAYDIAIVPDFSGRPELRFSTLTWNSGLGPNELVAGETGSGQQNVYQRVYLDDGNFYDRLAGTFVFHFGHSHFHFQDYALYTLQPIDAKGQAQRESSKTTFCLIDTDKIDPKLPGAPKRAVFQDCDDTSQGISVGWGDEYASHLPGQEIDLTDLADGDYRLIIEVDPKNRLLETNDGDNESCVLLRISVVNQTVDVLNDSGCEDTGSGEVMVFGIDPSSGSAGSLVPVTITGSGFVQGMDVVFENGSGARPSATAVTVLDANTVTAIVTIKKKGKPNADNVWDVRIGSGVLTDGFMVLP